MSKIKENLLRNQDEQMKYMSKFFDYLYDNVISLELSGLELDEMERESSLPNKQGILSNKTFKVANNKNYFSVRPLQGA